MKMVVGAVCCEPVSPHNSLYTEALRKAARCEDGEPILRRLPRRSQTGGGRLVKEAREPWFPQRWRLRAEALQRQEPELFARLEGFATSDGGAKVLAEFGVDHDAASFMMLGLVKLGELLELQPPGTAAADHSFARLYHDWSQYGFEPDPRFCGASPNVALSTRRQSTMEGYPADVRPIAADDRINSMRCREPLMM